MNKRTYVCIEDNCNNLCKKENGRCRSCAAKKSHPKLSEEHRKKISLGLIKHNKNLTKEEKKKYISSGSGWVNCQTEEVRRKKSISAKNRTGSKNSFFGKHHTEETKNKLSIIRSEAIANGSINIKSISRGYKGYYFSEKMSAVFHYDSALEFLRMTQLDEDELVISWTKKHGIMINLSEHKRFVPDFLIEYSNKTVLEEVKGYDQNQKIKKEKMKEYCLNNELEFSWKIREDICSDIFYRAFIDDNIKERRCKK